ncbi:formimidoylglutamase [Halobacillus andaensis]|uniref:Formimidoylglutamase n=1 Tax=Halobacillus andaensis TaxID=1176239 RepID=A0A917EWH2_HALAA|nr:agmatinase family protein [Halobacillus andaensis]MBP2005703.1 formiminoglutamase [Halobacillus andaensis]GGF26637.1 formimidoylglutamase [Halobacillus andaensis]
MTDYPYPMLDRPDMIWSKQTNKKSDLKVHEWIETLGDKVPDWSGYDVTLLGVPLSKSSISTSAACENPEVMRRAWKSFETYNLDEDLDLSVLKVLDLGNVKQHTTDILQTHENIKEAMASLRTYHPHTLPIMMGGDHSITAMLIKGWKQIHPDERIGILQFDTHFDLRDLKELGPANGTPIRNLIESETIKGKHVHNIGLHGFFNSRALRDYADKHGVCYTTMKKARKQGMNSVVNEALKKLESEVDTIYVTVDMDVLDITQNPAAPAATPGGMYTHELFDAVQIAGEHPKVKAMDIVCLDPRKDVGDMAVKSAVHVMLSFLTGYCRRSEDE